MSRLILNNMDSTMADTSASKVQVYVKSNKIYGKLGDLDAVEIADLNTAEVLFTDTKSLNLDGVNQYGTHGYNSWSSPSTIVAWIRSDTTPSSGNEVFYNRKMSSAGNDWTFYTDSTGELISYGTSEMDTGTVITDARWHLCVWVADASATKKQKVYIDGVLVSDTTTLATWETSTINNAIGNGGSNLDLYAPPSVMNDVAIFQYALTDEEVWALWNQVSEPSPIFHAEVFDGTIYDISRKGWDFDAATANELVSTSQKKYSAWGSMDFLASGSSPMYTTLGQGDSTLNGGAGDMTADFWFKTSLSGTPSGHIFSHRENQSSSSYSAGWIVYVSNSKVWVYFGGGNIGNATSGVDYTASSDGWNFARLVRSGSFVTISVNGSVVGTTTSSTNLSGGSAYSLNIGHSPNSGGTSYFVGQAESFRYFIGHALSTTEVPTRSPTGTDGVIDLRAVKTNDTNEASCKLHVQSNHKDGSGVFTDLTGTNTITEDSSSSSESFTHTRDYAKWGDSSITLSGSASSTTYLDLSTNLDLSGDFTIEAWFMYKDNGGYSFITWTDGSGSSSSDWGYFALANYSSPGRYGLTIYDAQSTDNITEATSGFPAAYEAYTWYHVAAVRSGSTITLYRDGTSVASDTASTDYTGSTGIFGWNSSSGWNNSARNGFTDSLRFYTTALTASEIAANATKPFKSNFDGTARPPSAWWQMESGTTEIEDSSANANTLTLVNSPTLHDDQP